MCVCVCVWGCCAVSRECQWTTGCQPPNVCAIREPTFCELSLCLLFCSKATKMGSKIPARMEFVPHPLAPQDSDSIAFSFADVINVASRPPPPLPTLAPSSPPWWAKYWATHKVLILLVSSTLLLAGAIAGVVLEFAEGQTVTTQLVFSSNTSAVEPNPIIGPSSSATASPSPSASSSGSHSAVATSSSSPSPSGLSSAMNHESWTR